MITNFFKRGADDGEDGKNSDGKKKARAYKETPTTQSLTEVTWKAHLDKEFTKPYFGKLSAFVEAARKQHTIFPKESLVFAAFNACPFNDVKVVILGQDPYHGPNQACGLSFSVTRNVKIPPSLRNMYKELNKEYGDDGFPVPKHGDLSSWASQGVLLLNDTLTVKQANANSHAKQGWSDFTLAAIRAISGAHPSKCVFILWGKFAQTKGKIVDKSRHKMLTSAHPSPLSASRGFFGCNHFKLANEFLVANGRTAIDWNSVNGNAEEVKE